MQFLWTFTKWTYFAGGSILMVVKSIAKSMVKYVSPNFFFLGARLQELPGS